MRAIPEHQISAFLANTPGVVANLCATLAERGVNIKAIMVMDTVDVGTVRMVVDNLSIAKEALTDAGAAYVEVPVIAVPIPNQPGSFAKFARTLANAKINIEYFYATATPGTETTLGIFRVSDHKAALELEFEV
ncbi:MAG: ACT domain-containing protein [Planctomycetes bacterium]|nr:ACT domain-containing protein [Planctomycetota bacterium]MCH8966072.1 ACT domain-containing protein [Planctomycetota bacterium]